MFGPVKATVRDRDESIALPTWAGLMAGLAGTGVILVLVMEMLILLKTDVWTAAHDTLAVLLGADYTPDTFQILVGSIVHLLISAALGAVFTAMPCCLPRNFWIVAGLIYGIGTGIVACFLAGPMMMLSLMKGCGLPIRMSCTPRLSHRRPISRWNRAKMCCGVDRSNWPGMRHAT